MKLVGVLMMISWFVACDKDKDDDDVSKAKAHNVLILCYGTNDSTSAACVAEHTGATAYFGLTTNTSGNCVEIFNAATLDKVYESFTYSSTDAVTWNVEGGRLEGDFSEFVDSTNTKVTELNDVTYLGCAYIDINGNQKVDSGEPLHSNPDIYVFHEEDAKNDIEVGEVAP